MLAENLGAFVIAAFALTGSPGPATLGLSAAAAAFGLRRSLMLMTGIIVGVLLVFAAAAAGLTGLILAQPLLGPLVKAASVLYMLWLAWSIATAPPLSEAASGQCAELLGRHVPRAWAIRRPMRRWPRSRPASCSPRRPSRTPCSRPVSCSRS